MARLVPDVSNSRFQVRRAWCQTGLSESLLRNLPPEDQGQDHNSEPSHQQNSPTADLDRGVDDAAAAGVGVWVHGPLATFAHRHRNGPQAQQESKDSKYEWTYARPNPA